MAGPIQLTETDFDQIKKNLINYLKSTEKFTDYDFEGSNLSIILNLLAYQAQLNAYSINMVANESFLATSSIRNNVVANARQLGYTPTSAKSANTLLSFTFDLASNIDLESVYPGGLPSTLQIQPGYAFNATDSTSSYIFNVLDPYSASITAQGTCTFEDVPVYEGVLINHSFVRDYNVYNQKFILENKNIDTTSIRVEVQESSNRPVNFRYTQAKNLSELDETSRVFWLEEVNEGFYELTFGDGLFGKKLEDGAKIFVDYLITSGATANGIRGNSSFVFTGTVNDSFGNRLTVKPTVTNSFITDGGSEVESVSSIKFRAPKLFGSQARCVTSNDYETIIYEIYPSIQEMYVFGGEELPIPEYGRVYVVIKPQLGETLSNATKNFIKKSLENYRIASLDVRIVDPEVLYVESTSIAYYDDTKTLKDSSTIRGQIVESLRNYTESIGVAKFGGVVKYSKIVGIIDDVDESIVRNITSLRMRKNVTVPIDTAASYEICFENLIKTDYENPVVYSTGFMIPDDPKTYYFENIPPEIGATTAKVQRFHFDEDEEKVVDDLNFGDLDLIKGELLIGYANPITISKTLIRDDVIEVRALPHNNGQEIKSTGKVYMEFDVSKSQINVSIERGGNQL